MGDMIRKSGMPGWAWGILLTSFITLISFTIRTAAMGQRMESDIITNSWKIEKHDIEVNAELEKKASKELMQRNYEALLRIENKLDEHIAKTD